MNPLHWMMQFASSVIIVTEAAYSRSTSKRIRFARIAGTNSDCQMLHWVPALMRTFGCI
jgi:hypothetical protein